MSDNYRAAEAFRKALFIHPNHIPATVYLSRVYLSPITSSTTTKENNVNDQNVDLAAGLLSDLTHGPAWDVPEAWYYLAKAYKLQGRRDRECECLSFALTLSKTRGVRDIATAIGWCL
jgi:predicted Zn-dependent protease